MILSWRIEGPYKMLSDLEKNVIRCVHADLVGALQAFRQGDMSLHDWRAHALSITDLEYSFPTAIDNNRHYKEEE